LQIDIAAADQRAGDAVASVETAGIKQQIAEDGLVKAKRRRGVDDLCEGHGTASVWAAHHHGPGLTGCRRQTCPKPMSCAVTCNAETGGGCDLKKPRLI
jgi:hypothetical protein